MHGFQSPPHASGMHPQHSPLGEREREAARQQQQAERERDMWNQALRHQQQQGGGGGGGGQQQNQQQQNQQQPPPAPSSSAAPSQPSKPPMHSGHSDRVLPSHWSPSPSLMSLNVNRSPSSSSSSGAPSASGRLVSPSAAPADLFDEQFARRSNDGHFRSPPPANSSHIIGGGNNSAFSQANHPFGTQAPSTSAPGGPFFSASPTLSGRGSALLLTNNNSAGPMSQQSQSQSSLMSRDGSSSNGATSPSASPSPDPFNSRANDPARIQALIQVVQQLHESGVQAKFMSQLGIIFKQLHPSLFVKGILKELVDNAVAAGLLVLSGTPGQQQVELTPNGQAIAKQWRNTHQLQNMQQMLEMKEALAQQATQAAREQQQQQQQSQQSSQSQSSLYGQPSQSSPAQSASTPNPSWTMSAPVSSSMAPLSHSFHSSSSALSSSTLSSSQHTSPRHANNGGSSYSFLIEGDSSLDAHAPHLAQHRSASLLGLPSTRPSALSDGDDMGIGVTDAEDSELLSSYNEQEMLRELYKSPQTAPLSSSNQQQQQQHHHSHGGHQQHSYSTTHSQANSSQSSLVSSIHSSPHSSPVGGALLYHSHQSNNMKAQHTYLGSGFGPQQTSGYGTSPSFNSMGSNNGSSQNGNNQQMQLLGNPEPPLSNSDLSALQLLPPLPTGLEEKTFRGEKLKHLKYIFHFRVHPCLNFLQRGSCPYDNKNECFDYHSLKTRRRIPRIYSFSNGVFWSYNACRCQAIEKDMRCEKGEACRYAHCFEDSAQILTERGFMFRHELEACAGTEAGLPRIGTYNRATRQLEYQEAQVQADGRRILVVPAERGPFDMVEFGDPSDRAFWAGEGGPLASQQERSHHASLLVSSQHTMWAARWAHSAYKSFDTELAADLFLNEREASTQFCMQATVSEGLADAADELGPLRAELGVTVAELGALCELYGYWLGDGFMHYHADGPRLGFYPKKDVDKARLRELFVEAGLGPEDVWISDPHASGRQALQIRKASWAEYFDRHYGRKGAPAPAAPTTSDDAITAEGIKSPKWLLWWARKLGKALVRRLLAGLSMADGDDANLQRVGVDGCAVICTSSVRFRDEVMHLLVHAGFAAVFHMHSDEGASRGVVQGVEAVANVPSWRIEYTQTVGSGDFGAQPVFHPAKDMIKRTHTGSLWCVTVPNGLIIARRAKVNQDNAVVAASRAVVVGNCKEEIAYHPSRYKSARCSYPLRSDGSCSRFGLHCAFSHGDHDTRKAIVLKQGMPHKLVEPAMHVLQEQQKLVAALTGLTLTELNGFSLSGHNNSMSFGANNGAHNSGNGQHGGHHSSGLPMGQGNHVPSGMNASSSNNGMSAWEQQLQQRNALHHAQSNGSTHHLVLHTEPAPIQYDSAARPNLNRVTSGPTSMLSGSSASSNLPLGGGGSGNESGYGTAPSSPSHGPINTDPSYLASLDPNIFICPVSDLASDRDFFLYSYKTKPCTNQTLACTKGECNNYHFDNKRRRNPRQFRYSYDPCPAVKQLAEAGNPGGWRRPSNCRLGDQCSLSHTQLESMYHPSMYKLSLCPSFDERDRSTWQRCPWKRACAHAHSRLELEYAEQCFRHEAATGGATANANSTSIHGRMGSQDLFDSDRAHASDLSTSSASSSLVNSPHFGLQQHQSQSGQQQGSSSSHSQYHSGNNAHPSDSDDSLPGVPAHLSALGHDFLPSPPTQDLSDDSMRSVLLRQDVAAKILRLQSNQLQPSPASGPTAGSLTSQQQSQLDSLRTENAHLLERCNRYEREYHLLKLRLLEKDSKIKQMQWSIDTEVEEKRRIKVQLDTLTSELTQRFLQQQPLLSPQQQQQQQSQSQQSSHVPPSASPQPSSLSRLHIPSSSPSGVSPSGGAQDALYKGDTAAAQVAEAVLISPHDDENKASPKHVDSARSDAAAAQSPHYSQSQPLSQSQPHSQSQSSAAEEPFTSF